MANETKSSSSAVSSPLQLNTRTHRNNSKYCCSVQFLVQNHANFSCSAAPGRLMYFQNGFWHDFSTELQQKARLGFLEQKPIIEVSINGSQHYLDFMRMLHIDIVNAKQRSIAWIDENGSCFFPKEFVGGDEKEVVEKS